MRALQGIREVPSRIDGSFQGLLAQFSATTLELSPSLGTREFAQRLTARTSEMLKTRAAVLVLEFGPSWEVAAITGPAHRWDRAIQQRLAQTLVEQANLASVKQTATAFPAEDVLGEGLAHALAWQQVSLISLRASGGALLGVLCLVDPQRAHSGLERQVLEALASYASVALENVRLFSKIEQSRKQWLEDFDTISDLIVVHGPDGRILRLNKALAEHLGLALTEAIGRDMGALALFASPPEPGGCPFCRALGTAEEDFSYVNSGRAYVISTSHTLGGEGSELRTIHVLKDITEKREAERRYRHEHDFNRNILNNSQSMILVLDASGTVRYANRRCSEVGYREAGMLDRSLVELVATPRRPQFLEALERSLQGNTVNNLEVPLVLADGTIRQFSTSLSPMRDENSGTQSVVAMMSDITDAVDLQSKLMHTEKMAALGQLVSGVAHEVNNPLAAIVGFTDLLLEDPNILPEAKEELRVILQEAQRTRVIVQNLLSFARQMPPQQEPVQINILLEQTLQLRAYDLANHGVELTEHFEEDLPLVVGDSQQLQQVFLNILNNAYDAVREVKRSGRIDVATSHRDGYIEIIFQDNGPGIANPERIFDPFFTTKEVGKGTGLGLSICYGIVRSHRGEVSARNNSDGVGCTFILRLPSANHPAEIAARERSL